MPLPWRPNTTLCLFLPEAEDFGFESFGKRIRETEREKRIREPEFRVGARLFSALGRVCTQRGIGQRRQEGRGLSARKCSCSCMRGRPMRCREAARGNIRLSNELFTKLSVEKCSGLHLGSG